MTQLSISLLGPFQVTLDNEPVADFGTDKARALLAYLAVEADRPHRREALAGLLWPDQPERRARHSLRQALSHLRRAIGDDDDAAPFLLVTRGTVQFNPDSDHWLDVATFTNLIAACQAHRHRRRETCLPCMRRLREAIELYRGGFLDQFSVGDSDLFEDWALLKREWLQRQAVEALAHLANYYERRAACVRLCRGEYELARQYAWRNVELEPWREEAHRQLMRILALEGQRSAALAQYETCRRMLAEELGVEPTDETTALYEQICKSANLQICRFADLHNLPPSPTPFIGRKEKLAELTELLANPDCRLLTLVGPGGIGKSRLALRVAEEQVGAFADGVFFVSLAPVSSVELLLSAIADVLDFSFQGQRGLKEQLSDYLREKDMLLTLDNLEHLLPASPPPACGRDGQGPGGAELLAELLRRAPGVVLLVTSRERLNLQEEWVHEVKGLAFPENGVMDGLESCSAITLFLQSARRARRDFSLADQQTPHVVRICQLVAGIPLGIELAAAWVAARSCREIAQEIEHNLDVLTTRLRNVPQRHQSMRATFEHSWQLLTEAEKALFARLSIFRGGFRQEAATQVAGASPFTLLALLDKSLIRRVSSDRFDLHELLRQYAADKLRTNPQEFKQTQARHSHHFAAFLERQEKHLQSSSQKQALLEIAPEVENVRQAWRLAVSRGDAQQVEQSLTSLYLFLNVRCRFQEGIDLFNQVVEEWRGDSDKAGALGRVLARQGALYRRLGRYRQARITLEESQEILERLGVQRELIFGLVTLADVLRNQGNYEQTTRLAQESLALSRQTGDSWGIASSLFLLGMVQYRTGDIDQAQALLEQSLTIGRESGNQRLIMSPLNSLGDVACHRGDYAKARVMFEECLALSRELDDQFNVAMHLNNLGTVLHVMEKYKEAQPFYQESLEICREIGDRKGQAVALSNLGEIAHELGDHSQAFACYQEGLSIGRDIQDQWTVMIYLNNMGQIACTLGGWEAAQEYLAEALKISTDTRAVSVQLQVLFNLATLFAGQGQIERAAALFGLVCRHPASEQDTRERAGRMLDELRSELSPQQRTAAEERGQAKVLQEVVEEILGAQGSS